MIRLAIIFGLAATQGLACARVETLLGGGEGAMTQGASCRETITLNVGPELVCFWEHDLRAASATEQFEALVAEFDACLVPAPADLGVNHPDTYDLRRFGLAAEISVALKDKGALGQTLVVLRVTQP